MSTQTDRVLAWGALSAIVTFYSAISSIVLYMHRCNFNCLRVYLKPRPHQQQCRSNIVERYKLNDSFDSVECCFDIVAVFGNNVAGSGNNVERNFILSTMSKGRNFTIEPFDIVAVCGNKVECCFDKVERCFDNVACCFDIVAGVDGA